jgi:hypothetical protein
MQDGAIKNDLSSRKLGPSKGLSSLVHCVTSSDLASLAVPDQSTATLTWINAIAPVPHGSRSCPRFAPSYVKLTQLPLITYNREEKAEAAVLNLSCHYGLARHATLLTLRHIHQDAEIIFATQDEDARSCLKDSTDFNQTLLI